MVWLGWVLATPAVADDDNDRDGWEEDEDCDDDDPSVHPGAPEGCDGIDSDCDGGVPLDEADLDGDHFALCEGDCDDADIGVNPDAVELCNDYDDDCDLEVDEGCPTTPPDTGGPTDTGSMGGTTSGSTPGGTTSGTAGGTTSDPAPDTTSEQGGVGLTDRAPAYQPLDEVGTGCTCETGPPPGLLGLWLGFVLSVRRRR